MSAAEILVILLSIALAIFLVLGIILLAYLIVVIQKIRKVAENAQRAVGSIDGIIGMLRKAAPTAIASRIVVDILSRFMQRRNKK